ncbi:MAG TPA: efflux RND transporter periplasmic adaptor subunit [Longimicrobiales bacterium]|nr:efflux RND transporter periplasmic adaptor subunit [Longimicrobiales bacterium]
MTRKMKIASGAAFAALAVAAVVGVALSNASGPAGGGAGGQQMGDMPGMSGMSGMDMGAMDASGSARLSARDIATFGITFGSVEVRPLSRTIRAVGLVEFDETRMVYVAPKFGGWAERLHVDFTGQIVRAGQPLLDVYAPELVTAQEELLLAAAMLDSVGGSRLDDVTGAAADLFASSRRRLEYWDISEEQIGRLLETREVRKALTLHAPATGVVMEKDVFAGQAFQPGANLYMIADLSEVWVNAEVFEGDAALVREGMPAEVTVEALPGRTFSGRIEYVYPTLQDRTRSMRARIALANPGAQLKPGMFATVRLRAEMGEVLTLPASAVLHTGERAVTFVDMGGGALMPHELELGVRGGDFVQVLSGVEPGQRVVTSAQFLLDSESNLAEVMRAMMAQMNMSDMDQVDMGGMDMGGGASMGGMDMPGGAVPSPDTTGGR